MKALAILVLLLALTACATNPYDVCNQPEYASNRNDCVQQVQTNEQRRYQAYSQMLRQNQINQQTNYSGYNYQMPVRQSVQTNCVRNGAYTNCSSY